MARLGSFITQLSVISSSSRCAGHACLSEQPGHVLGQLDVQQAGHREVDRHAQLDALVAPRPALAERAIEHPEGERAHEPGVLDERNELHGSEQPADGVGPAHEGLDAGDLAGSQVDLGLVVQHELVVADGPPQLAHEREVVRVVGVALGGVDGVARALVLGHVHGHIRALEQGLGRRAVLGVVGHAHARLGGERHALQLERLLQGVVQALGDLPGTGDVRARQEDGELVAAHPGDRVPGAQRRAQPRADLLEQEVAVGVAHGVVDLLEPVEVDDQHRQRLLLPLGAEQRLLEPVVEEDPVRQARERIVVRLVAARLGQGAVAPHGVHERPGEQAEKDQADRQDHRPGDHRQALDAVESAQGARGVGTGRRRRRVDLALDGGEARIDLAPVDGENQVLPAGVLRGEHPVDGGQVRGLPREDAPDDGPLPRVAGCGGGAEGRRHVAAGGSMEAADLRRRLEPVLSLERLLLADGVARVLEGRARLARPGRVRGRTARGHADPHGEAGQDEQHHAQPDGGPAGRDPGTIQHQGSPSGSRVRRRARRAGGLRRLTHLSAGAAEYLGLGRGARQWMPRRPLRGESSRRKRPRATAASITRSIAMS